MPVTIVLKEGGPDHPEWTLSVSSNAEGARLELRTSRTRLVIAPETPEMAAPDLLSRVLGSANELEAVQGRIRRMADEVPEPPDEMLEHEMPYDLHAELLTTLECVAEDDLDGAIEKLRAAAAATPEQLRRLWEEGREAETEPGALAGISVLPED
jgi:hypothetical protein